MSDAVQWALVGVGLIGIAVYYYFRWAEMSENEKALFLQDLVQAAEQKFRLETNEQKFDYVIRRLQERFPGLPLHHLERLLEAEVYRQKQLRAMAEVPPAVVIEPDEPARWN